jgi:AraC-like DNA-binding protein
MAQERPAATSAPASWENLAEQAHYRPHDLARASGVSLRTLQRHFRAHFNCTVTDWLRNLRLERARNELRTGESVKQVAFDLGYKQPSHFTRDFKDRFGVPPRMLLRGRLDNSVADDVDGEGDSKEEFAAGRHDL